ncbi:MAG: flavin reductase family protein [Bacteroidota bacterium]|jgi:flavin reductase (DIM6/NTAB) family NADH-FMN oxidoreductase RutF
MLTINPKDIATPKLHSYLLSAVAPRPIAFASTLNEDGTPNLSPFSFYNVFSSNPPIAIFSPARRVRNNTTKHTLDNVKHLPEVVLNAVNYDMVQQMSLSSTEYPYGVNEFEKAGFTPVPSELVKPFRVKESPVQMECIVKEVIALGNEGGAGNLIVCEIVKIHIHESILDSAGNIDQHKIDLVARLGSDWYSRNSGNALFEVPKPLTSLGIGVDAIPAEIRNSSILTGNDLGKLGNVEKLPIAADIANYIKSAEYTLVCDEFKLKQKGPIAIHEAAKHFLNKNDSATAWKILLSETI